MALGFALMLFGTSKSAEAIEITNVSVGHWRLDLYSSDCRMGVSGVDLAPVEDLVLTQNFQGPPNINTSTTSIPATSWGLGTSRRSPSRQRRHQGLHRPEPGAQRQGDRLRNTFNNEAQDYGLRSKARDISVPGYADNTHTGACGLWAASVGLNGTASCLPSVFNGMNGTTAATYFDGAGGFLPPELWGIKCSTTIAQPSLADCFEGGVIRIVATTPLNLPRLGCC